MIDVATLLEVLATARDYAIVGLAGIGIILGIWGIVLLAPVHKGLRRLRRSMPMFMHRVQTASATGRRGVQSAMGMISAPFLWLEQTTTQARELNRRVRSAVGNALPKGR
ncbi:MAG: hypothetical protein GX557_11605 [Chloroflexi bacterium]|nr:hypothetical protein [Chloroflexota bacterium]